MKKSLRLTMLLVEALNASSTEKYMVKYIMLISSIKKYLTSVKKRDYDPQKMSIELAFIINKIAQGLNVEYVVFYKHIPFVSFKDAKERTGEASYVDPRKEQESSTKSIIKRLFRSFKSSSKFIRIRLPLAYSNYIKLISNIFGVINSALLQSVTDQEHIEDQDRYSSSDSISNRLLSHEAAPGNMLSLVLRCYADSIPIQHFTNVMEVFLGRKPPSANDTFIKLKRATSSTNIKLYKLMDYETGVGVESPQLPLLKDIFYVHAKYGEGSIEFQRLQEFIQKSIDVYSKYARMYYKSINSDITLKL